jgi:hypothetical protein
MHLAFDDAIAGLTVEVIGQRLERPPDERPIVGVAERQGVGAGQQPAQHAVFTRIVSRTFVVHAAAAEGVEHEPRTGDAPAPERPLEEDRNAQVVAGPVVVGHVSRHRTAQLRARKFNGMQPVVRQCDDDGIEVFLNNGSALPNTHGVGLVLPVAFFVLPVARDPRDRCVELHVRAREALCKPPRQHVHATFD